MKHVYLLRHAKSSWEHRGLPDHERPLAPRGRKAAPLVGTYLREQGMAPTLVLCSSAVRAQQTLDLVNLAHRAHILVEAELYLASARALLQRLRELPAAVPEVMLVGHNPGMQQLAVLLAGGGAGRERLREKFPTAALAVLAAAVPSWDQLDEGAAELRAFVRPRDLKGR
ncbi:MAG: histidine phosphatase family protein [Nitriliruptorales bacterium]|nr:histidine phosphatase family protein [Nitriliruptorales bacterium]